MNQELELKLRDLKAITQVGELDDSLSVNDLYEMGMITEYGYLDMDEESTDDPVDPNRDSGDENIDTNPVDSGDENIDTNPIDSGDENSPVIDEGNE